MSKTVDERVVEMRFDNGQFERNVQTSMSTLAKLKQSLNLTGASKGLNDLNSAAKKVDLSGMGNGIDTIHAKFSALQVMGITALTRITNQAITAGERMAKALTIDPIKSGFREYETQINAVQTILANTQKEGATIERVNAALDELNKYADLTIYNFTEMTRNIGTFTAAGVDLDTSVNAIQGIANLAAVSGSTSQQASVAMYQLSQALSTGTVRLMDWNSVVNAGMGGQVFQDALRETSELLGTGAEAAIKAQGSFRESLNTGWLTSEVLTETLKKFTTSGANEYVAEYTGLSKEAVEAALEEAKARYGEADAIEYASKALAEKSGKNQEEIKQALQFAKTAEDAATKVKTFTQLWDVLKEAAQSGWAQTWRIIIGDFEEAKGFFTPVSKALTNIIEKMSSARNTLLESALGKSFSELGKKMQSLAEPAKKVTETVDKVSETISDLGSVVDDVILGKFGNGQERFDALTKSGKNYYEVQNKVNEKLGNSKRYTQEQIDAQNKLLGVQKQTVNTTEEVASETGKLTDEQKKLIKQNAKLSDSKLKALGYSKEQIAAFQELRDTADKLGLSVDDLVDNMDQLNGRWLLLNSVKNIGRAIVKVFSAIGEAWKGIFKGISPDQLFDAIAGFHKFTSELIISDDTAKKITSTFKGLFAILHLVSTIAGGGLKIAFTIVSKLLNAMGLSILDVTAKLGDAIVKFHDFIFNNALVNKGFDLLAKGIQAAADAIKAFFDAIIQSEFVQGLKDTFGELFDMLFGDGTEGKSSGFVSLIKDISGVISDLASGDKVSVFGKISKGLESLNILANSKWALSLTSGLKILNAVLELFGTDLSTIGTQVVDFIDKIRKWVEENTFLINTNKKIAKVIAIVIEGVKKCIDAFLGLEPVQKIIQNFRDLMEDLFGDIGSGLDKINLDGFMKKIEGVFTQISEWIKSLKNSDNLGRDIVAGLVRGIWSGIGMAASAIAKIAETVIEAFCSILGIASPSKVFFEFGTNIIEGLMNGVSAGFSAIVQFFKELGSKIIEAFKNIDFNFDIDLTPIKKAYNKVKKFVKEFDFTKLLSLIPISVVLIAAKQLYDVVKILENGISGVNAVLSGFADIEHNFAKVLKSFSMDIKAKAIQKLAISIAILVGAVIALTLVDPTKLAGAVFTIVILSGVLVALAWAMNKLSDASVSFEKGKGFNIDGLKTSLIQIGAALLMVAAAVKIMGSMNMKEIQRGFLGLAGVVAAIGVVILAMGVVSTYGNTKGFNKAGSMILKISFAMLLMVGVCKLAAMLKPEEMEKAEKFVVAFTIFVAALSGISYFAGKNAKKLGSMILRISFAMILLVGVCKLAGMLTIDDMKNAALFASGFLAFVAVLCVISALAGMNELGKISGLVFSISASMLLLVGVCKLIGLLKAEEIAGGIAFALGFLIFVGLLVQVTKISSTEQTAKVAATILAFSIAIGILAAVCILMGMLDIKMLAKGVAAVSILGSVMALMIWATRGANNVMKNLIVMTVAIAVMAGAVVILSTIKPKKLAGAVAAMSILMGMFALIEKEAANLYGVQKELAIMLLVVGGLAGIIYLLAKLPVESVLASSASLSLLLLSLSASCYILGKIGYVAPSALEAMKTLTLVVGGLAVILGLLAYLDIDLSMQNVLALSVMLIALAGATVILGMVKSVAPTAIEAVKTLGIVVGGLAVIMGLLAALNIELSVQTALSLSVLLLALVSATAILSLIPGVSPLALAAMKTLVLVVGGLAIILGLLTAFDVAPSLETALALSTLLLAMAGVTAILSIAGVAAPAALAGVVALGIVVAGVGGIILALGMLNEKFPQMEKFLNEGLPILEKIGYGLGSFFGNIISGLLDGVMSSVSNFGTELSNFMTNLQPFLDGASKIDESSVTGIKMLAEAILILTGASLIESITSFLTGGSSLTSFAAQLVPFGVGMKAYANAVTGINTEAITASAQAAKGLAEVAKAIPKEGGLWQLLSGEQNLGSFGTKLVPFGVGMKAYANAVTGINTEAITASAQAAKGIADVANAIPKEGGLWQLLSGEKDLGSFGTKLVPFGEGMKKYAEKVSGIDNEAIVASVSSAKAIVKVANAIPKDGGLWGLITGDKDLGSFGKKLIPFGDAMKKYASKVTGIDNSAISASVAGAKAMVRVADAIPADLTVGASADSISAFGNKLVSFAGAMRSYAANVAGISAGAIIASVSAAKSLVSLLRSLNGINASGATAFVTAINTLGKAQVSKFVSAFTGASGKLKVAGANMLTAVVAGIRSRQGILVNTATSLINLMHRAFASKASVFRSTGSTLMAQFANGISSRRSTVSNAVSSTVSGAASRLRSSYGSFYSAGSYLAKGFANGISSGSYAAAIKARAMAQAAEKAARNALKINSPSKVFMKIGGSVPEGFAKGIAEAAYYVDKAVYSMSDGAISNTKKAIARVGEAVNMNVDAQPTIRPVLDLSDVQAGAGAINGMFSDRISLGATANVDALSSTMNQNRQNGFVNEVVSAIGKLRKDLGNTGGNTYIIDGVTYDDGSNISEAVQAIVQAARVERRI